MRVWIRLQIIILTWLLFVALSSRALRPGEEEAGFLQTEELNSNDEPTSTDESTSADTPMSAADACSGQNKSLCCRSFDSRKTCDGRHHCSWSLTEADEVNRTPGQCKWVNFSHPGSKGNTVERFVSGGFLKDMNEDPNGRTHVSIAAVMLGIAAMMYCNFMYTRKTLEVEAITDAVAGAAEIVDKATRVDDDADAPAGTEEDEHREPTFLITGLFMRFADERFERQWESDSQPKNMRRGSALLAGMGLCLVCNRAYKFTDIRYCKDEHIHLMADHAMLFSLCSAFMAASWLSACKVPNVTLYWFLVAFFSVVTIVISLPPWSPSCGSLVELQNECLPPDVQVAWSEGKKFFGPFTIACTKMDCTLQGHTACQIFQLWLLILPFVLPQFWQSYLSLVWLFGGYVGASLTYMKITDEWIHFGDLQLHMVLLLVTLAFSTFKKFFLEKGMRFQFVDDYAQRAAYKKLYTIFQDMVPEHVIPRMIEDITIADPVSRVTVLFVVIDDFNAISSSKNPEELLKFLNEYFSQMDRICQENKVTKIETVANEYVACVGVMPEDSDVRHGELLERLFTAAHEIMDLQTDKVKFKMGAHSGPIIAGVIGHKLPRFRLFGDTINTSARMMQKALPGTLQFGLETRRDLPDSIPIKERGEVMMKGKGKVLAFIYDKESSKSLTGSKKPSAEEHLTNHRRSATGEALLQASKTALEMPKDDAKDEESDKLDKIIESLVAKGEQVQGNIVLSQAEGFTDETPTPKGYFSEAEWLAWFHESFCIEFAARLHRQAMMLTLVTMSEVFHMEHIDAYNRPNRHNELLQRWADAEHDGRFLVFFTARICCFVIMLIWSALAGSSWMKTSPAQVQTALVATNVTVCCLLFVSYDAAIIAHIQRGYIDLKSSEIWNQELSLVFALAVFMVCNEHEILFWRSLAYLPLTLLFWRYRDIASLYISDVGRVIFVFTAVLTALLAHEGEQNSRARFKARIQVERTQKKVEKVLDSLMPPMVVKELRAKSPGEELAHPYKLATIAQSDLCGFTQLSSTKQPREIVGFMSDLFGRFDKLTDDFDIYKVETVGDAYIAGMAEAPLTEKNSPVAVVQFGMAMIEATNEWARILGVDVKCRVGVHHGECMGGIVGRGMMRYHLFGEFMDAVDTLEATSREGVAQVSRACKAAMDKYLKDEGTGRTVEVLFPGLVQRTDEQLTTSKGEVHEYAEVGGSTFLIYTSGDAAARQSSAPVQTAAEKPPAAAENPPAAEKSLATEIPAATEKPPAAAEKPQAVENPPAGETPAAAEKLLAAEKSSAAEEAPAAETPAAAEKPPADEKPPAAETPAAAEKLLAAEKSSAAEEAPAAETPAAAEKPPADEKPPAAETPAAAQEPPAAETPPAGTDAADKPAGTDAPTFSGPDGQAAGEDKKED
eukprot:TRINITY_DN31314_c0_g1_i1.p1 TRINITY_DN31314_c0_g1~~TRINITY_DN31314_c0_g1_i1.p1  ORF type:complete len:1407 (-),score=286.44 TRINITY_DN31314_c0_g1_i1:42-4262(-)